MTDLKLPFSRALASWDHDGLMAALADDVVIRVAVRTGDHTTAELAELFNVARSTVYRTLERARQDAALDAA